MNNRSNPPLQLKITFPSKMVRDSITLIQILRQTGVLEHANEHNTFLINPPKGANNEFWARTSLKAVTAFGVTCSIIRPSDPRSGRPTDPLVAPNELTLNPIQKLSNKLLPEAAYYRGRKTE